MWQRWRRDGVGRREAKASGIEEGTKHSRLRGNKRMTVGGGRKERHWNENPLP